MTTPKQHFAHVIKPDGSKRPLKNLGWLLRNWQAVESLSFDYCPDSRSMIDGVLSADISDNSRYESSYSSLSVCWNWLDRPIFRGKPFRLGHSLFSIGGDEWRTINRMPFAEQQRAFEACIIS